MSTIVKRFLERHRRSREYAAQGEKLIPGGITHDVRQLFPFPLYMEKAEGAYKWDVDGNRYVDFVMGHGALILGHAHPEVTSAAAAAMQRSTHLGGESAAALAWAARITRLVPSAEMVKFTGSGTEATMLALRLSRAFTGREKTILFEHHFHGWNDLLLQKGAGIPSYIKNNRIVLPPGDADAVEAALRTGEVAAVILEPTGASWGSLPLGASFSRDLRELTRRYGSVLIFDEVVTGFRVAPGGVQESWGITPDLTTLAKCMAGGFPGGAVAGKKEVMAMLTPRQDDPQWNATRRASHPGTFNANPVSAAAGSTALDLLASGKIQQQAAAAGETFKRELNRLLRQMNIDGCAFGDPSIFHLFLGFRCPRKDNGCEGECTVRAADLAPRAFNNYAGTLDAAAANLFKLALLNRGVDLMGAQGGLFSAAHGEKEVSLALEAFAGALGDLRAEGML